MMNLKKSPEGRSRRRKRKGISLITTILITIIASIAGGGSLILWRYLYEDGMENTYTGIQNGFIPTGRLPLGVAWQPNPLLGWGTYGLNLIHESATSMTSPVYPIMLEKPHSSCFRTDHPLRASFIKLWERQYKTSHVEVIGRTHVNFPVIHAVPESFVYTPTIIGSKNVGSCFLERFNLKEEQILNAHWYDLIITGSTWNTDELRKLGLHNVHTAIQGVDTALFYPPSASYHHSHDLSLKGKFVVFSGGKLELRKGQDLVIVAFREFVKKHPDAILATAWHNAWPEVVETVKLRTLVRDTPHYIEAENRLLIRDWLEINGIPKENSAPICDVGELSKPMLAALMKRADVAVFPNRCEGGTNLVAMEAMASGIPCIMANNTGQSDIVHEDHCYSINESTLFSGEKYAGYSEVDPASIVKRLEEVYTSRKTARKKGQLAAYFIQQHHTWKKSISRIHSLLQEHGIYRHTQTK